MAESTLFSVRHKVQSYGDEKVRNGYRYRALIVPIQGPTDRWLEILVTVS